MESVHGGVCEETVCVCVFLKLGAASKAGVIFYNGNDLIESHN